MTQFKIPSIKKMVGMVALTIVILIGAFGTWFKTDAGFTYVVQNTLQGKMSVFTEPGVHFKIPFFNRITEYKQVATISFSGVRRSDGAWIVAQDIGSFTRNDLAVNVPFADTYTGHIPATFRFRLPRGEEAMLALHSEFRSFDNLVDSLLTKNAKNVLVVTGTQYTGEEFFQGGVNAYKVQLEDQLRNGLYQTQRRQVIIESTELAAVTTENSNANTLEDVKRKVWKNVILTGSDGQPLRQRNPFDVYGVEATQVTLGQPIPSDGLDTLLENKRTLVATRIAAVEELQTAEAQAAAAQQSEEIATRREVQIAQRTKDLAVIAAQQKVDVQRQVALQEIVEREKVRDLAVIDKDRELAIAVANQGIQEAAALAAEYEADAIRFVGLAEADVSRAMLQAKEDASAIYLAEIQRDIARVMYPAFKGVNIDMPDFYYAGGDGAASPTALDVFSNLAALDQLEARATSPTN